MLTPRAVCRLVDTNSHSSSEALDFQWFVGNKTPASPSTGVVKCFWAAALNRHRVMCLWKERHFTNITFESSSRWSRYSYLPDLPFARVTCFRSVTTREIGVALSLSEPTAWPQRTGFNQPNFVLFIYCHKNNNTALYLDGYLPKSEILWGIVVIWKNGSRSQYTE